MSEEFIAATITVQGVSKFGVKANDQWFGVDGPELAPASFVPGQTYGVGLKYSKTNKPYIKTVTSGVLATLFPPSSVLSKPVYVPTPQTVTQVAPVVAQVKTAYPPAAKAPASDAMSKAEWAEKDRRISRLSILSTVFGSQAYANAVMADEAKATMAALELAEQLELWAYRQ